jgi:hypothetical protein
MIQAREDLPRTLFGKAASLMTTGNENNRFINQRFIMKPFPGSPAWPFDLDSIHFDHQAPCNLKWRLSGARTASLGKIIGRSFAPLRRYQTRSPRCDPASLSDTAQLFDCWPLSVCQKGQFQYRLLKVVRLAKYRGCENGLV